jgi:FtsP/CotA-like multicopper oxidase with cupredoxin domain
MALFAFGHFAYAQSNSVCPRPAAGATVQNPPELRSQKGVLEIGLHLRYQQTLVSEGPPRYCYITDDGLESPTLRVNPGDHLIIHLHNDLPEWHGYRPLHRMDDMPKDDCVATSMDPSVTNLHFHGMTIPPVCHQDEVIRTAIGSGQVFDYRITIPLDEPPGLYWYHPHPHGFSERQVQGGASGALIVEGLQQAVPSLANLDERVVVLRDLQRIGPEASGPSVPAFDISANWVPITYSRGGPATIQMARNRQELWRVLNAGADTIFNLQILVDRIAQPVEVVAIDGVPVAHGKAALPTESSILLPPGARAEFLVTVPQRGQDARLVTQAWDTGPQGDNDTARTIAKIVSSSTGDAENHKPAPALVQATRRSQLPLSPAKVPSRVLYFSQHSSNPQDPDNFVLYYLTVQGQTPTIYKMGSPPNIVVHQGDVEEWTIENRSPEDHVFHIHQIHFIVQAVNGKPINDPTERDTIDVPYWSGTGPYPSVKLRMDFRNPNTVGTFLYHCHILKHEDLGMMGSIQVLPLPAK